MKISVLIEQLQLIQAGQGPDIEVVVDDNAGHVKRNPMAMLVQARVHHEKYLFLSDYISKTGGYGGRSTFTEPYQTEITAKPDIPVVLITRGD